MLLNPYEYQLEGVRYALDHQRCIFGDQPGLGKTLQAICTVVKAHKEAHIYGDTFPVLVICPAALKVNWQREFKKFAGINAVILDDKNRDCWERLYELRRSDGDSYAPVFITNYESLKKFFVTGIKDHARMTLRSIVFDERVKLFKSVIIDESHNLRNGAKGSRYRNIKQLIDRQDSNVLLLTATPYNKDFSDLANQLRLFIDEDQDLGMRPETYIRNLGGERQFMQAHSETFIRSIAAFDKSDCVEDWNELMKLFLVRRTRTFIRRIMPGQTLKTDGAIWNFPTKLALISPTVFQRR